MTGKAYPLLIDGRPVWTKRTLSVVNPATEEVVAQCALAGEEELEASIAAAKRALPEWSMSSIERRRAVVIAIADAIRDNRDELARLIVLEQGKPQLNAVYEVMGAERYARYFADMELPVRLISESPTQRVEEHRRPLGIVAGILPWNFPFMIAVYKLVPAIMAGNAIILKPAPTTPISLLRLGELVGALVPPGIVQLLADDNDLGARMSSHADIAKVSFTGSTATGKAIARNSADTLKRLTLELGGNDAALVLDDVNLDTVTPKLFGYAFANSGQVCVAIKRLFVQDAIYDEVCDRMAKLASAAVVGDGFEQGVQFGPVQNRRQFDKVLGVVDSVRSGEGTIVFGGERIGTRGYFLQPTIVRDVQDNSRLVAEETFGPILPILRFATIDEAVERANASSFGLGASVWSSDVQRAHEIARRLDAGTVWVNQHMALAPDIPLRGAKQSGLGVEMGVEGFHEYTSPQIINIAKA